MSADLAKHWWDSVEQIAKSFRRMARCLEGCEFISQQGCRPNNKDNVPAEGIEWKVAVAQSMVCWYEPVSYCCQSWFKSSLKCQRMWAPTLWDLGRFHIPLIQIKALAGKLQCIVGWWRSWLVCCTCRVVHGHCELVQILCPSKNLVFQNRLCRKIWEF